MNKYFQIALTFLWIELTGFTFLILLSFCGLRSTDGTGWLALAGWTASSFSAGYFITEILILFPSRHRKPILAEEERIRCCLEEVTQRADGELRLRLLIDENTALNATAMGHDTISVSRGIVEQMSDAEIKGILAHELGHLKGKDPLIGAAFVMAGYLPKGVGYLYRWMSAAFRRIHRISRTVGFISIVLFDCFLYLEQLLLPAVLFWLYVKSFIVVERWFLFLLGQVSRHNEYKQDGYAFRLGFGSELRQALYKLTVQSPPPADGRVPKEDNRSVIYDRIRKLEKLEGLR
jgi:Zn-dependent protease with chaperone function